MPRPMIHLIPTENIEKEIVRDCYTQTYPLFPLSFCLHLDAEEVAQLDLRNVVADKLVVLEVCAVDVGVARLLSNVGLLVHQQIVQKGNNGEHQLTIWMPLRLSCTTPASIHLGGAVIPIPQVLSMPPFLAVLPAS